MFRFSRRLLVIFLALCALSATASDELLRSLQPQGFVSDYAHTMTASERRATTLLLAELKQKTGAEVAVVTLPSLGGGQIDDFANRLFERWGIGDKRKDNGLLLLAAIEDRKARIEVGYGLEGAIPDSRAGRILREDIFPHFRQGQYGSGILAGVSRITGLISQEYGVALQSRPAATTPYPTAARPAQRKSNPLVSLLFFIGFIYMAIRHPRLLLLLLLTSGRGGRGGYSRGGFGGGGFGGFGGGMSGGGGASGGW